MAGPKPLTRYRWPAGHTSATCFTVDVDAHAPWLWANRGNRPRLLGQIEARRFGPRTGLWRITDLLARHAVRGTFFVPAVVAEDNPEILPALCEMGHEVALHGYYHEQADEISDDQFTEALERSIALFEAQTGRRPQGFRSPAWEMTEHMLGELDRLSLYDSSLMGQDQPYTIDGICEVPVQWTIDDAVHFKFLGGGADRWPPSPPGPVLEGWLDEWRVLHRFGGLFMLTVHDWISGRAQRIAMLERLFDTMQAEPGVWFATVAEVAAHHRATCASVAGYSSTPPSMTRLPRGGSAS